ncbi:HVA22-like protein f [Humulus lupulus]|uniref:HVA22-like protein f n=1 Tax=Humulus lupulus TaxID=3486 RepID=UPI002B413998|nr:HVA22-like protein f [Humulus lupulus]
MDSVLRAIDKRFDTIIAPGTTLVYPLFAAIESTKSGSSPEEHRQWLTYWVLYSFITLFERSFWMLPWIPLWWRMKHLFCMWLVFFNGATLVHEYTARTLLLVKNDHKDNNNNSISMSMVNSNLSESQREVLEMMDTDARNSVESYIEQHGLDAFDRVIKAAEKEAKKH